MSPMRHSRWERSRGFIRDQGEPASKALRAATTARSASTAEAWATWTSTSSVAGSTVAKVWPSLASTHSPSMSSCFGEERNELTAGRRSGRSFGMVAFLGSGSRVWGVGRVGYLTTLSLERSRVRATAATMIAP